MCNRCRPTRIQQLNLLRFALQKLALQSSSCSSVRGHVSCVKFMRILFLSDLIFTAYAIVALIGAFGNRELLTPLTTMIPAVCAKIVSCIDPWYVNFNFLIKVFFKIFISLIRVYAISHPRYRQVLEAKVPWLGIREPSTEPSESRSTGTTATSET